MKTPTVDDSKPKRDKLGPTGPANIADEEPKGRGDEAQRTQLRKRAREYSRPQAGPDAARLVSKWYTIATVVQFRLEAGALFLVHAVDQFGPAGWQSLAHHAVILCAQEPPKAARSGGSGAVSGTHGLDLRGASLTDRKRVLEALFDNASGVQLIKYVDHIAGNGELVLEHACKLGLEGIVSKRADAPYRSGKSPEWVKTKCPAWREANRDRFEKMDKSR